MIGLLSEHRVDGRCGRLRLVLHDQAAGPFGAAARGCRGALASPSSSAEIAASYCPFSASRFDFSTYGSDFWQHHLNFLSLPHGHGRIRVGQGHRHQSLGEYLRCGYLAGPH